MLECAVQFAVRGRPRRRGAAAAPQPRPPPRRQQQRHPPSRWAFSCFFFRIKKNIFLDLAVSSPHFYSAPLCSYEKKNIATGVLPSFAEFYPVFNRDCSFQKHSPAPSPLHPIKLRENANPRELQTFSYVRGNGDADASHENATSSRFFFLFFLFVFLLAVDFFFIGRHVMVSRRMNISMETP